MNAAQQAALVELTQAVLANAELPVVMRRTATLAAHALALEYTAIWELLPERSALVLRAGYGWQAGAEGNITVGAGAASPVGYAVLRDVPVVVADWRHEKRVSQPDPLRDQQVVSGLYVAISGQDELFGALSADSGVCRTFSGAEILFLQAVANVLALAIQRDQSSRAIKQQVEGRTRAIEQRLLAAAQNQAVLEERQRLARDLHDSVTQALYGITLHAQAAWRLLASDEVATAAESLRALQETAQEALDEMRLLIFELRPPILEQVGLAAALQARLTAVEGRANLQTRLIADGIGHLSSVVEQALYRIAQEALNNALKHAHAKHITVQLRQAHSHMALEIIDDGVGFDPAVATRNGGLGLRGIEERVAQLEGRLTVRSAPGSGTQLCVELVL
jgi:signal transduction histidine kinase